MGRQGGNVGALDVDPRHAGDQALAALEAEHGPLPRSLRTVTGGGGAHILFAWPDDGSTVTNANGLPPGLDTRGEGGLIVLPPTRHASGDRYRWEVCSPRRPAGAGAGQLAITQAIRKRKRTATTTGH